MSKIKDALDILVKLDFPRGQRNERSALCLLALSDLKEDERWQDAKTPRVGITPIMDFAREHYRKDYRSIASE